MSATVDKMTVTWVHEARHFACSWEDLCFVATWSLEVSLVHADVVLIFGDIEDPDYAFDVEFRLPPTSDIARAERLVAEAFAVQVPYRLWQACERAAADVTHALREESRL